MDALLQDLESHIKRCDGGLPAYIQRHGLLPELEKFQDCGQSATKFRAYASDGKLRLTVILHDKTTSKASAHGNVVIFTHPWPSSGIPVGSIDGWEIAAQVGSPTTLGCAVSHLDWWLMSRQA